MDTATRLHTLRVRVAPLRRNSGMTASDVLRAATSLNDLCLRLATLQRRAVYGPGHKIIGNVGEDGQFHVAGSGKHEGASATPPERRVEHLPITSIHVGLNPREYFDPAGIAELAATIQQHGLLQPITVRPHAGGYQIIAGERRFRAMQTLGYTHVPALVLHVDDAKARELALIENINRVDMKPGETARAYQALRVTGLSVKQIGDRTGKTAEHIQQHLDLLTLPDHLQRLVDQEKLPMGIVRDLAKLNPDHQEEAAERILREDLGVKSAKRLIRAISDRQNQTSMFADVRPVTHTEKAARQTYEDAIGRMTAHLAQLDDHHMELTAHALEAPAKETERLKLMIKQLERMKGILETESFRRTGQASAPAKKTRKKAERLMRQIDQRLTGLRLQVVRLQVADVRRAAGEGQQRDGRGRFASGGGPAFAAHREAERVSRTLARLPADHPERAGLQARLDRLNARADSAPVTPQDERELRLLRHVTNDRLYPAGQLHPRTAAALAHYVATVDRFAARRRAQGDLLRLAGRQHGHSAADAAQARADLDQLVQELEARQRGQRVQQAAVTRTIPLRDDQGHYAGSVGGGLEREGFTDPRVHEAGRLQADLQRVAPHIAWDITRMDPALIREGMPHLLHLGRLYPGPFRDVRQVLCGDPRGEFAAHPGGIALTQEWRHPQHGYAVVIHLAPERFAQHAPIRTLMRQAVAEGWHPPNGTPTAHILTHEFGHVVDLWLERQGSAIAARRAAWHAQFGISDLSGYARESAREAFAETFLAAHFPTAATRDRPDVQAMRALLQTTFGDHQ